LLLFFCAQDLSYYKYDKMVNRSLALLNKFYSSKSRLFKMGVQAMVCTTGCESVPIQLAQCWFPGLTISNATTTTV